MKPENLLLDHEGHVRLIDFGLALAGAGQMPTSMEHCGTPCYMAPEVKQAARRRQDYSHAADWYTLGWSQQTLTLTLTLTLTRSLPPSCREVPPAAATRSSIRRLSVRSLWRQPLHLCIL